MSRAPVWPLSMRIASSPAQLCIVRAALERECELIGFDEETIGQIVLSIDEALTNVIRHAYDGEEGHPIEVELIPLTGFDRRGLRVRIRDYGHAVEPSSIAGSVQRAARVTDAPEGELRPGGLGVHIMRQCMDEVTYAPARDGGTLLTMTKRLPDAGSETRENTSGD